MPGTATPSPPTPFSCPATVTVPAPSSETGNMSSRAAAGARQLKSTAIVRPSAARWTSAQPP